MDVELIADSIAVIAFIGQQRLDLLAEQAEQCRKAARVVRLAAGQDEADRAALTVASGVDLGGEAAARAAQSFRTLIPPFTPAAL